MCSGLSEITYGSFEKSHGFRDKVCAADVVYSVNALLESSKDAELIPNPADLTNRNFWDAFSSISGQHSLDCPNLFEAGVEQAINLQKLVVMQGKIAMDKVTDCGGFNWVNLSETLDSTIFAQPLALSKLALFLSAALRHKGSKKLKCVQFTT